MKKRIMIAGWVTAEDTYEDYIEALQKLGADAFLSLNPADFTEADGLLLPGSSQDMNPALWGEKDICSHDINDALDHAQQNLLELAAAEKKPVLGICRGMQFINVFFGGTLIQDLSCSSAHQWTVPEHYHAVLHLPGTFMMDLYGETSEVNTRHHQGCGRLGKGLEPVSVWHDGEDSVVEAVRHTEYAMIGVQWHPEKMFLYGDESGRADGFALLQYFLHMMEPEWRDVHDNGL